MSTTHFRGVVWKPCSKPIVASLPIQDKFSKNIHCICTSTVLYSEDEPESLPASLPARHRPRSPRAAAARASGKEAGRGRASPPPPPQKSGEQFRCRTGAKSRKSQGCGRTGGQPQRLEAQRLLGGSARPPPGAALRPRQGGCAAHRHPGHARPRRPAGYPGTDSRRVGADARRLAGSRPSPHGGHATAVALS